MTKRRFVGWSRSASGGPTPANAMGPVVENVGAPYLNESAVIQGPPTSSTPANVAAAARAARRGRMPCRRIRAPRTIRRHSTPIGRSTAFAR